MAYYDHMEAALVGGPGAAHGAVYFWEEAQRDLAVGCLDIGLFWLGVESPFGETVGSVWNSVVGGIARVSAIEAVVIMA